MTFFYLEEEHPNHVYPGKRTMQTITPSIALKNGKPYLAFGTPGGDLQEQSKLQTFLNIVEFGMTPQEAVEVARFQSMHPGGFLSVFRIGNFRTIRMETRVPEDARNALAEMGYTVASPFDFIYIGYVGIIRMDAETGWKEGAADPRGWNIALGW
jgi:gamma-glutamyltranspeptidase/glutathione hydrolase